MSTEEINVLLLKYNRGEATQADIAAIEQLIERNAIQLSDLKDVTSLDERLMSMESPTPSTHLDDQFYATLAMAKAKQPKSTSYGWFPFSPWIQKLAFASLTFILGITAGYFLMPRATPQQDELATLTQEVSTLKEMMMLSLLEKESATDRLRAVSLSQELDQSSQKVTSALMKTLNNDDNINVRLAALEALKVYGNDSNIRKQLIESISQQDSPLVQIALAEVMAALQEKSSVQEFEKLLQDENTPAEVKSRIRERIEVLI